MLLLNSILDKVIILTLCYLTLNDNLFLIFSMFDNESILKRTPEALQISGIVVTVLTMIGIGLFHENPKRNASQNIDMNVRFFHQVLIL